MEVRKSVFVPLQNGTELLQRFVSRGEIGAVVVPSTARVRLGDEVDLELAFVEEDLVVHTRGVAGFEVGAEVEGVLSGVGVELLASERRTRDLILEVARGKVVTLAPRQSDRVPARITVAYKSDAVFATDVTDDLSQDGAFIRTDAAMAMGERLTLELEPPGFAAGIVVGAEVVWCKAGDNAGIGVKFIEVEPQARQAIDTLLDKLHRLIAEDRHGGF